MQLIKKTAQVRTGATRALWSSRMKWKQFRDGKDAGLGLVEGAHKEGTSKHSGCVTAQWSRKNVSLGHENGLQIILLGRSKNIRRRW